MNNVVFVTRLNGSAKGCCYLQAICEGDNDQFNGFSLDLSFLGISHGYVEASNYGGVFCFNAFNGWIVLCNPLANTSNSFPRPSPSPLSYIRFYNCGFCYDAKSDDHKVIRIFDVVDREKEDGITRYCRPTTKSELFSFRRNCWKEIQSDHLEILIHCTYSGYALVGCSYHWLIAGDDDFILAFNFSEEIFSRISLPSSNNRCTSLCHIIVNTPNNLLGVIFYSGFGEFIKTFEVWEYGIDGEWSKLYDDAIIINVEKPLNLNGSLMYVSRETSPGCRQLLVYDWVGRTSWKN